MVAIVWFRNDLRLSDHLALSAAVKTDQLVLPLYIYDQTCSRPIGGAAQWWLHHSLGSLQNDLKKLSANIVFRKGNAFEVLKDIYDNIKFSSIFWHDRYDQEERAQDEEIKKYFSDLGVDCRSFNGSLMFKSESFLNKENKFFKTFSSFWRHCIKEGKVNELIKQPAKIKYESSPKIKSDNLDSWKLLPSHPNWAHGFSEIWEVGEQGAQNLFKEFLQKKLSAYKENRDKPAALAISDLSPHIRWGEISPRQLWHNVQQKSLTQKCEVSAECFLKEVGWREFSYYTLYNQPKMVTESLNTVFENIKWSKNKSLFQKWTKGQTGYPLVDAGMRQLWQTGYMHNRVRLVVASFLIKNLSISWKEGENWFWDTLVDADPANNPFNWQWVAGCGTDAAPYFRVFNPILQSKKFDPSGEYIKTWVKELRDVPEDFIHEPWLMDKAPSNYPAPIIDFYLSRNQTLEIFKTALTESK